LIVKEFEINTTSYYQKNKTEVPTNIDLDGIIAARETVFHFTEQPLLSVFRTFKFPEIKKRGLYVNLFLKNYLLKTYLILLTYF